jgi:Na+-translocating ferredoxin:NAD+ oxidoreductase RnfD subunit
VNSFVYGAKNWFNAVKASTFFGRVEKSIPKKLAGRQVPERKLHIFGKSYPLILPTLRDPRLHLAAVIISLQLLGQVAFDFQLSIAQILVAIFTCGILEFAITLRKHRVIMWPASALLTGNGVAFVLRVPGTVHGNWWSMRGWYIFAGTAAVALISKYIVRWRGHHIFNPSNFGLVLCFVLLGPTRVDPLALWWGPMSAWMVLALGIIVLGGFAILSRLKLLSIAATFWLAFALSIAVLAASGHGMTARWHLGVITGFDFWRVLVFSPEVLVFLFFMITDPKTTPISKWGRRVYAVLIALLATLLIAPQTTEYWTKVSLLGALTIVCALRPIVRMLLPRLHLSKQIPKGNELILLSVFGLVLFVGFVLLSGTPARHKSLAVNTHTNSLEKLPPATVTTSKGVDTQISSSLANKIASDILADFKAETEALTNRDKIRAELGANDSYLLKLRRKIDQANGGTIIVPVRRIDSLQMHLETAAGQTTPLVIATVLGTQKQTVIQGNPPLAVSSTGEEPFNQVFELQIYNGHYLLVGTRN